MTVEPLVSVVIPVLNGERHLAECLNSVLGQSYENLEIVIADNGSSDRTVQIIEDFMDHRTRQLPLPESTLDVHSNWERALSAAKGEFVKLVCHDDVLDVNCIASQSALLMAHPQAAFVGNRRRIIDDQGRILMKARGLGSLVSKSSPREILAGELFRACTRAGTNLLGEPASLLIRQAALPAPLFDSRWHYAIDLEFYSRCIENGLGAIDEKVLCSFRVSPNQWSAAISGQQAAEMRRLFTELARRFPDAISPADLRRARGRAALQMVARRSIYTLMRIRAAAETKSRGRSLATATP